jgi:tetratricopeptide (TPR) repeat protein
MIINLSKQDALISAILKGTRPVSVLIGSPLSMPDKPDAPGVPSVQGILDIVTEHVGAKRIGPEYQKEILNISGAERYQKSLAFVRNWLGQDDVNQIIQKAVLKARITTNSPLSLKELDSDVSGWYLPRGIKALGEIYSKSEHFRGPILTTNFDPLIAVSIKKSGGEPIQTVLHADGSLGQHRALNERAREIIHLHGYWQDSDTLHTPDQLTAGRPKLKASLTRLLSEKTLLVIGYGGWDDIFLSALRDLMTDDRASLDVLWAFHETDPQTISEKYAHLIKEVRPAITRGRFRAYGGIECNAFLHSLASIVSKKHLSSAVHSDHEKSKQNIETGTVPIAHLSHAPSISEIMQNAFNLIEDGASIPAIQNFEEWRPRQAPAHREVREVEQAQLIEALEGTRVVFLVADWGLGKEGFLATVLCPEGSQSKEKLYRLDLEGITDREGLLAAMEEQLGAPLQVFVFASSKLGKFTLFLDGVGPGSGTDTEQSWFQALSDIVSVLIDFLPNLRVVISGRKELCGLDYPPVRLSSLDEADTSNYIKNHPDGGTSLVAGKTFDVLFQLSRGMPMQLDRLLSDLSVLSIDELLENESDQLNGPEDSAEPIPIALERAVNRLADSDDEHLRRCNKLLRVLSVLSFGEPLGNIKRFDNAHPFHPSHVLELRDLGLVEAISVISHSSALSTASSSRATRETAPKILTVPPQVREYIIGRLTPDEIDEIVKRAADLTFGPEWQQWKIKLSSSAREHLKDQTRSGAGNPHLLASRLLRQAIKNGDEVLAKNAFNIGTLYCSQLRDNIRYRDLTNAASELLVLASDSSFDLEVGKLQKQYGEALRMNGQHEESIVELNQAIPKLMKGDKSLVADGFLSLALANESIGNKNEAIVAAKHVKQFSKPKDGTYLQATSIIIECEEGDHATESLRRLECKARKNKTFTVANNILINLAKKQKNTKQKIMLYDQVINGAPDEYNQIRAVVNKGEILAQAGRLDELQGQDGRLLRRAYSFSFSQRFSSLFNKSHKVLWDLLEERNERWGLYHLFRYSSLIWRLRGDSGIEQEYAKRLTRFLTNESSAEVNESMNFSSIVQYVQFRVRLIFES